MTKDLKLITLHMEMHPCLTVSFDGFDDNQIVLFVYVCVFMHVCVYMYEGKRQRDKDERIRKNQAFHYVYSVRLM